LGLAKYDVAAPIADVEIKSKSVKIMLGQSIGVPSSACVAKGDTVRKGDVLGVFSPDKLGTSVHAPFDATVTEVTDAYVVLKI
jgi:Na+-translocating ferredoxin:NAD+ oxidoreductase RnfC subunit